MESNANTLTSSSESCVRSSVIACDTSAKAKRRECLNGEKTELSSPKRRKLSPIVCEKSSTRSSTDLNKKLMDKKITTTDKSKIKCNHGPDCVFGKKCAYIQALAMCSALPANKLVARKTVKKINQKCKYWPQCIAGSNCIYTHPLVMCTKFPMCRYGSNCAYTHPKCKFGLSCAKEDCIFSHSSETQCRYYPKCTKPNCPYSHPIIKVDASKFTWYKKN